MKYKSQLAAPLKAYVEWQLAHYHESRRELEQYKLDLIPSATPKYSLEPGSGGNSESRPLEDLTLRMASDRYIVETARNISAIEHVLNRLNSTDKKLIDLVYWKGQYTTTGAGLVVGYSKTTAYSHANEVLIAIAKEMGILPI